MCRVISPYFDYLIRIHVKCRLYGDKMQEVATVTRILTGSQTMCVAGPLRFRRSDATWALERVREQLLSPLDAAFGAQLKDPWFSIEDDRYAAVRITMDNTDFALFCYRDNQAYWLGNTETPEVLWHTEKETFAEAPYAVARWAQQELTARLEVTDPWLAAYEYVTWFFLPVFFSKDGRDTTRRFFAEDAAGFPDASADEGLSFYESILTTGVLDEYRYTMASKLVTSAETDLGRMRAAMAEFNAAKLLNDAGLTFDHEVQLDSGHALDFEVDGSLIEVTRPEPPARRQYTDSPTTAIRDSGAAKMDEQLSKHPEAVLCIDCTSFSDAEWKTITTDQPMTTHSPTVVYRARPNGRIKGYPIGTLPFDLHEGIEWV